MSHVEPPRDGPATDGRRAENRASRAATKVVLMELAGSGRPLSAAELRSRTLLSDAAVEAALADLRSMGFCRKRPGDDRRPTRYVAEEPPETDTRPVADD